MDRQNEIIIAQEQLHNCQATHANRRHARPCYNCAVIEEFLESTATVSVDDLPAFLTGLLAAA